MNVVLSEYDAFQRITHGLQLAADGAKMVAQLRPDQRDKWLVIAKTLEVTKDASYQLAAEGVKRSQ